MVVFPNAKINLGLNILRKREDGYHDIESVFYPIGWTDILEVLEYDDWRSGEETVIFHSSGIPISGNKSDNLISKAHQLLSQIIEIPPVKIRLHKTIPMGAGLGGGSSNAAFYINLLDEKFNLGLTESVKNNLLSQLGSDCVFFLKNEPLLATGRGNIVQPIQLNLSGKKIAVVYPNLHSTTATAYKKIIPSTPDTPINELINRPLQEWKLFLKNDFEKALFPEMPKLKEWKMNMYDLGAEYASLTGSGSAVYGIFEKEIPDFTLNPGEKCWKGIL